MILAVLVSSSLNRSVESLKSNSVDEESPLVLFSYEEVLIDDKDDDDEEEEERDLVHYARTYPIHSGDEPIGINKSGEDVSTQMRVADRSSEERGEKAKGSLNVTPAKASLPTTPDLAKIGLRERKSG